MRAMLFYGRLKRKRQFAVIFLSELDLLRRFDQLDRETGKA